MIGVDKKWRIGRGGIRVDRWGIFFEGVLTVVEESARPLPLAAIVFGKNPAQAILARSRKLWRAATANQRGPRTIVETRELEKAWQRER